MSLLEFKNKFKVDNPKRGSSVSENKFFNWTNKNFYRTSYNDMRSNVSVNSCLYIEQEPVKNKNMVIPGYQGYVPQVVPNNKFAHTISETSRKVFKASKLDDKPHMFSTTG